jgi:hypothetical protein
MARDLRMTLSLNPSEFQSNEGGSSLDFATDKQGVKFKKDSGLLPGKGILPKW